LPANFAGQDANLFAGDLVKTILRPHVAKFQNVKITAEGILFRDGLMMPESFARPENFRRWRRKRRNKRYEEGLRARSVREVDHVVWVTDDWSKGYFHWLADVLPKLVIAADHLSNSTILLPARFADSDLVKDSFRPFGVIDLEFIKENETVIAKQLYLPSHTDESGDFDEAMINEVRRVMTVGVPQDQRPEKRIYISRTQAKRRKIVNDKEVSAVLADFGFETIFAENLSFAEQARLFSSVGYLISLHGAGLSNMLFMPAGGRVMELRKNDPRVSNCFFNMASALEHEYYYQLCPATDEAQAPYSADLAVDIDQLGESLARFLREEKGEIRW
jgi:capsular polysaccharide biosynthesis protein